MCGFIAGRQDNWIITQHISRMVNGTALRQVTVQVDFIMNTCDIENNCRRSFAIHKYETSTINTTAASNLSNYEFVGRIVPRDGSGSVRENGSVNINFATDCAEMHVFMRVTIPCCNTVVDKKGRHRCLHSDYSLFLSFYSGGRLAVVPAG